MLQQIDFGFASTSEDVTPATKPTPRAKGRAADWQRQLARAFLYVHGRAQTPEEAAELERFYAAALAEGPDFTRCRSKSEFKDAPKLNLDRNAISRMMVTFYTLCRNGWVAKDKGKHRGLLSRCAEDVFKALIYLAGKFDRLFPSLKGLAYLARCCPASVSTALDQLEAFGIVTRHRRLKRVMTPLGFKVEQNTNAYEVHPPKTALGRLAEAVFGKERPMEYTHSNYSAASAGSSLSLERNCRSEGQQGGLARVGLQE
jgi:DNA-binding transcriptional regulator YhcF (GntR family)